MSHPLLTISDMDSFVLIIAVTMSIALVIALILLVARGRGVRSDSPPINAGLLAEQVAALAGEAFRAHMQAGQAESARRQDVFDAKWDPMVGRVKEELAGLRDLVTTLQHDRAVQQAEITQALCTMEEGQRSLVATNQRLNEILGSAPARGQWGERMADDVLRAAGMVEGVNYFRQQQTEAGTRPDFSFVLPDGRRLHMDVKFPLDSYVRFLEADSALEAKQQKKSFGSAVQKHIRDTASRDDYKESIGTVGFVLMFIPNEAVYSFVLEHHRGLFDEALSKQVLVCSPFTLFGMVSLVRQAMDTMALKRASEQIRDHLAGFEDQWDKYLREVRKVEGHLERLNGAFTRLTTTRERGLQRTVDRIQLLKTGREESAPNGDTAALTERPRP